MTSRQLHWTQERPGRYWCCFGGRQVAGVVDWAVVVGLPSDPTWVLFAVRSHPAMEGQAPTVEDAKAAVEAEIWSRAAERLGA